MSDNFQDPNVELPEDDVEYVDILTLSDEDGVEHEFELADALDIDDRHYVALIPTAQSPDELLAEDGELVIMRLDIDETGEEFYALIEDDDEFYHVSDIFEERLADLYEFEDGEGE